MTTVLEYPLEVRNLNERTGEFEGYASVFDVVDSYNTSMVRGAFKESLEKWKKNGRYPALLWQHKRDEPIGVYTHMEEDSKGLKVEGTLLVKDDPLAKRAYSHLKAGSINGLSVGFITELHEYDSENDVTLLKKVTLMEVSLVTFPANQSATITGVRSTLSKGEMPAPKIIEQILRDAGFSRSQAKGMLSRGYKGLTPRDAEQKQALKNISNIINNWSFSNEY